METQKAHTGDLSASKISINWAEGEPWKPERAHDLASIFFSTQPIPLAARSWFTAIHELTEDGKLLVYRREVPMLWPSRAKALSYRHPRLESYRHQAMKYSAAKWLETMRFREVKPEVYPSAGIAAADIYSPDHGGVVVECGNTDPARMQHLSHLKAFIVAPYCHWKDGEEGPLTVYVFTLQQATLCPRDAVRAGTLE